MDPFKLTPSSFAFLWEECGRCFYLQVVLRRSRPSIPMAKSFNRIDGGMKAAFTGRPASELSPTLPHGIVEFGDKWVRSEVLVISGVPIYILGRTDGLIAFDDRSQGYRLFDNKTADVRADNVAKYARQLHGYAWALERPGFGAPHRGPITRLGLKVFEPGLWRPKGDGSYSLEGEAPWIEVPRDDDAFAEFLQEVAEVLALPTAPDPAEGCPFCAYQEVA